MNYYRTVKKSYLTLHTAMKKPHDSKLIWLYDNFYVFSKALRAAKYVSCDGLSEKLADECRRRMMKLTEEDVLRFCQQNKNECTASFIYSIAGLLCGNAIIFAADSLTDGGHGRISDSVSLIRTALSLSVQEIFRHAWLPEQLLDKKCELYPEYTEESKNICRKYISDFSRKKHMSELAAAEKLIDEGLCDSINKRRYAFRRTLYFAFCLSVTCALIYAGYTLVSWAALTAFLPVYAAVESVADIFLSRLGSPFVFRIKPKKYPKTAVVVSTLLFGPEKDGEIFENIEQMFISDRNSGLIFCLLADLCDSSQPTENGDDDAINFAKNEIDRLKNKYGDRFCMILRKRSFNRRDRIWQGFERKRGAVCQLIRVIKGEDGDCDIYGCSLSDVKYICALDRDTVLPMNGVTELLQVALHPANKRFHLFQPSMHITLDSAYKTYFSRLISGEDCGDAYTAFSFDKNTALFGSGSFCGKGLIEVDAFYERVLDSVPDGTVLSHDIVEGELLNTMYVPDVSFYDSCPSYPNSFCKRMHRWIRGDVQNSVFLFGSTVGAVGKYKLWANIRRILTSVFVVISVTVGALTVGRYSFVMLLLTMSPVWVPPLLTVILTLSGGGVTVKRYFSQGLSVLAQTLCGFMWSFCFVAANGLIQLDGLIRSLYRLASKKKLLEWNTAFQSENSRSGAFCLQSLLLGAGIMIFSKSLAFALVGTAFVIYPLVVFGVSKRLPARKSRLTPSDKEFLAGDAEAVWSFFRDNVGPKTNFLPPDNIQYSPCMRVAMRTSPTNIGLYLVSVMAARDFGFISDEKMLDRIENTVSVIEKLPKYNDMLYNWYDLDTLNNLDSFVSSVDEGNFVCCVCALIQGLDENSDGRAKELIRRLKAFEAVDLSVFCDEKRKLFSVGIKDGRTIDAHYDRLMSEFRLTTYYAVAASQCDKRFWYAASRSCGTKNGYIGMLSWAGTAFEYFMPQLFLPRVPNSFVDESLMYAFKLQSENRISGLWGVSESGYYAFDSDMNYAYRAHGVSGLAVKNYEGDGDVLSPYSVYLTLCLERQESIKAVKRYADAGMRGRYGLYEAASYLDGSLMQVRSYMSHHMGMSLIAMANACLDGVFVKRFMSDIRMRSAIGLLRERVPKEVVLYSRASHAYASDDEDTSRISNDITLISRGNAAALCDKYGHISLGWGNSAICLDSFLPTGIPDGMCVKFLDGDYSYGCAEGYGDGVYSYQLNRDSACYISASRAFTGYMRLTASQSTSGFFVACAGDNRKSLRVMLYFTPILCKERDFLFHPAYSGLFITSCYDEKDNAVYFTNRKTKTVLCVALKNRSLPFSFATSKEGMDAGSLTSTDGYADIAADDRTGVCINPLCLIRTGLVHGGRVTFIITCGSCIEEARTNLTAMRAERVAAPSESGISDALSAMLCALAYPKRLVETDRLPVSKSASVWRFGISGDAPVIMLIARESDLAALGAFISAFAALKRAFVRCELAVVAIDGDDYNRPVLEAVKRLCERYGIGGMISQSGGVFILREEPDVDFSVLRVDLSSPYTDQALPAFAPERILQNCGGEKKEEFTEDGFVVQGRTRMPYSWCMGNKNGFGCVVTNRSLGYTFCGNCREKRVCFFPHDPFGGREGERLVYDGADMCACADKVCFKPGLAEYSGEINGVKYTVCVYICGDADAKVYSVTFRTPPKGPLYLMLVPCAQNGLMGRSVIRKTDGGIIFSQDIFDGRPLYSFAAGGECKAVGDKLVIKGSGDSLFVLSAADDAKIAVMHGLKALKYSAKMLEDVVAFANSFIPHTDKHFSDLGMQMLLKLFLPYQVGMCRFVCRGSFYQAGGAYGFRDQLQDCMALVYSVPDMVRKHIVECCRHQYLEGDVMHWWHADIGGVRTRCGDDRLFLPLATAEYLRVTGDMSLLDEKACFLSSPPLINTDSRYEPEHFTDISGTVLSHCLKAFESIRTGKNGLAEMGSCDWNDAFSEMGGESMLTSFLFVWAADEFLKYAACDSLLEKRNAILSAAEKFFIDGRYARAVAHDGTVYGTTGCGECADDCAVQALAVFAGAKHGAEAALHAFSVLFDRKLGIMRLLAPAFDSGTTPAGDIRRYPPGIRENGGQYTHAAVWLARALFISGQNGPAADLTRALSPARHIGDEKYKIEPYVMAADIYYADGAVGRGGWSWYTGAAGWYYKLLLENYNEQQ